MKKEEKSFSIALHSGRSVAQPFRVDIGSDGRPVIKAADHFIVKEADGKQTVHQGRLKMGIGLGRPSRGPNDPINMITNIHLNDHTNKKIKKRVIGKIDNFITTYKALHDLLSRPLGNIPVQLDDVDLHSCWHNYLFSGRELIDEIGKCLYMCMGESKQLKGLNKQKLVGLKNEAEQTRLHGTVVCDKIECILEHSDLLIQFITARNDEKRTHTIVELPWINPNGVPSGGRIEISSERGNDSHESIELIPFIVNSFKTIYHVAKIVFS